MTVELHCEIAMLFDCLVLERRRDIVDFDVGSITIPDEISHSISPFSLQ